MEHYQLSDIVCSRKILIYVTVIVYFFCVWIVGLPVAKGEATPATSSFLRISADARGAAMGDAQGAMADDVYSMYWNPAGLANILFKEVGVTYQRAFQGLNYSFIGYAAPTRNLGTLAGQLFFLGSGSITATEENPDGSVKVGDSFSVVDIGLGFSQSMKIVENLSYGLNLKLLAHKIMDEQAFSLAVDAGMIYQNVAEDLDLGLVLQNLSIRYKFMTQELYEPRNLKFAALYSLLENQLLLAGDYNLFFGGRDTLNFGTEYWVLDLIALRAGMKLLPPAGFISAFSAGFGLNWRDTYRLDYSFSPHAELGANHRFSLIVRF